MDKPNLLAHIDRERAAALGVDVQEIADTLRVAVGGDDRVSRYYDAQADDAYDVELRLVGVDRADTAVDLAALRARDAARRRREPASRRSKSPAMPLISGLGYDGRSSPLTRLDNVVTFEETFSPSRIDRLDRQRMAAIRANLAPGYALADRIAGRAAGGRRARPAARLLDPRAWAGARELERTLERVRLDLRAVVHLHVHRAGGAVRAPGPSAHDPAVAAARRAVRPVQPVARRRDAQPLLGPGHPGAVRHGEEGVDPAGRPHQPAPRRGHAARRRRSWKATATACGRS